MITFEWRDVKRKDVIDSCVGGFESVHRIRGIVTMVRHGRRLRDFEMRERRNNASRRKRGYEGRGMRKVIDLNVTLRRRKRFNFLSFVDETISKSAG